MRSALGGISQTIKHDPKSVEARCNLDRGLFLVRTPMTASLEGFCGELYGY